MIRKLLSYGVKAEVLQITFVAGALSGMAGMTVMLGAIMLVVFASAKALVIVALLS